MSADPVRTMRSDATGWNRLAYARGSPIAFLDPDGRDVVIAVRDSAGGGAQNFGHVAMRVTNAHLDVTYDFGRYGGRAFHQLSGDGILRVWRGKKSFDALVGGQLQKGNVMLVRIRTSLQQDLAITAYFAKQIDSGKRLKPRAGALFEMYKLDRDYFLLGLNCASICEEAVDEARGEGEEESEEDGALDLLDELLSQGSPDDIIEYSKQRQDQIRNKTTFLGFLDYVNKKEPR